MYQSMQYGDLSAEHNAKCIPQTETHSPTAEILKLNRGGFAVWSRGRLKAQSIPFNDRTCSGRRILVEVELSELACPSAATLCRPMWSNINDLGAMLLYSECFNAPALRIGRRTLSSPERTLRETLDACTLLASFLCMLRRMLGCIEIDAGVAMTLLVLQRRFLHFVALNDTPRTHTNCVQISHPQLFEQSLANHSNAVWMRLFQIPCRCHGWKTLSPTMRRTRSQW